MRPVVEGLPAACTSLQCARAFTHKVKNFKINYLHQFFTKSHKNEFIIFIKCASFGSYNVSTIALLYDPCKACIRQNQPTAYLLGLCFITIGTTAAHFSK